MKSPFEAAAPAESPRIKRRGLVEGLSTSRVRSWAVLAFVLLGPAAFVVGWYWNFRRLEMPRPRTEAAPQPPLPSVETDIRAAQDRLKADPQDIGALLRLGVLLFEKGKDHYAEAINALEDARDLGALDARIFYCLGMMYQEVGLPTFAIDEYRRYLRNNPEDREIRMLEAKLLYQQGRHPEAVGEYERLKYRYPSDPIVEENLGLSLWAAKQYQRAGDSFQQLGAYGPAEKTRADFYMGQLAFEQSLFNVALKHLLDAAAGPGAEPDKVHAALALVYQKLGRPDDARLSWEKVLAAAPKDVKAQVALRELNRRFPPKKPKPPATAKKP